MLQGPEEFVGGLGRGVTSLVTNVVSGSLDVIQNVSGSLYSVMKSVGGSKDIRLKKADNALDGVYQGFRGGAIELFDGVTGVVTRPIEMSRTDGAKGAFVGVAQGVFGLVLAPVKATLRFGSHLTSGISQTATDIGNLGKDVFKNITYARFRPTRYIGLRGVVENYNEEMALVYSVVRGVKNGKFCNGSIKFYCDIPQTKNTGEIEIVNGSYKNALIIVTDKHVLYLMIESEGKYSGIPYILFKSSISKIDHLRVYRDSPVEGTSRLSQAGPAN